MNLFAYANHKASEISEIDPYSPSAPRVPASITNKDAFRKWSGQDTTKHAFVSMAEGLRPADRITNENPAAVFHGFIVDYDSPIGDDPVGYFKSRGGKPTHYHTSYSGHCRLVWEFEEPIPVIPELADEFLRQIHKSVNAAKLFPGYDETSAKSNQYFEIGKDWKEHGPKLSQDIVIAALFRAVNKGGYVASDIDVPIEMVAEEIEKRWPGRWKGTFELESRGPLFWIDDGVDRDGCQVKPDGMLCYSERAGVGFLKWRELLGNSFVEEYETKKISESLTGYYYDGKNYWRTDQGYGLLESKEDVALALRKSGFSSKAKKGQPLTEVEQAMYHIQRINRVDGAAPMIWEAGAVVTEPGGRKLVNTSRIQCIQPAADGDPTLWPWTYQFYMGFLDRTPCPLGIDPYEYHTAWAARTYRAVYEKEPMSGQAMIYIGQAGRGKTLWGRRIIGGLCGGFAEAGAYLTGMARFNKELSQMPVWTIDDQESAVDFKDQRRFTELLKKAVANPSVSSEAKGIDAQTVPWTGRVLMGANMDANSLRAIPSLDQSNRDKLMAFQISDSASTQFPPNKTLEAILNKELPHFARWLLDFEPRPEVLTDARYGVRSYFHPMVEDVVRDNSPRQQTAELIEMFVAEYRVSCQQKVWTGSVSQLIGLMNEIPILRGFSQLRHSITFATDLAAAEEFNKGKPEMRPIESTSTGRGKIWKIDLSEKYDV